MYLYCKINASDERAFFYKRGDSSFYNLGVWRRDCSSEGEASEFSSGARHPLARSFATSHPNFASGASNRMRGALRRPIRTSRAERATECEELCDDLFELRERSEQQNVFYKILWVLVRFTTVILNGGRQKKCDYQEITAFQTHKYKKTNARLPSFERLVVYPYNNLHSKDTAKLQHYSK